MGKLIMSIQVSLDGIVTGPDGTPDWIHLQDPEFDSYMNDLLRGLDGMIFGRVAYQWLSDYWPRAHQNASTPVEAEQAELMSRVPKLVLSRSEPPLPWGPASRIGGDLEREVAQLKRSERDVALFAGGTAVSALARLDLIDEYRLLVFPVIRGQGQRLFDLMGERRDLSLVGTTSFERSGVVALRYRRVCLSAG